MFIYKKIYKFLPNVLSAHRNLSPPAMHFAEVRTQIIT